MLLAIAECQEVDELVDVHDKMKALELYAKDLASNDWKANPDGKGYLQRIREIGRPGIQGRLLDEFAPAVERAIQGAFRKYAVEQARNQIVETAGGFHEPSWLSRISKHAHAAD